MLSGSKRKGWKSDHDRRQEEPKQYITSQEIADTDEDDGTRRCPRCGKETPERTNFCAACGFNLIGTRDGLAFRDPLIGVVIGDRYRLLSRIGVGGMGTVYKAEHVRMGKVVAVKLLHGDLSRDESMIRRFNREARAASRLSSPHTVSVFDYGQTEGLVYLVMEYLQGSDLGQVLRSRGPLSLKHVAKIVAQVADSLAEAHKHGIIHRDLKPENIFICAESSTGRAEQVKVLDFGLAKLRATREESLVDSVVGSIIGTPHYMSPEQITGNDVDVRSDVYSLGAVTYKLLTGSPPFEHANPVAVLSSHLTAPPPKIVEVDPELESVQPILDTALAKQADERFQSVLLFSEALTRLVVDPDAFARDLAGATLSVPGVVFEDASTRKDFDRFERRLKIRRFLKGFLAFALLCGAGYYGYWSLAIRPLERSDAEIEPNEDVHQATPLYPGAPIHGFIGNSEDDRARDVDYYQVENEDGTPRVARIEVSGVPDLNLVIHASDEEGQQLADIDSWGEGEGEIILNIPISGHYAYVRVRDYWIRGQLPRSNLTDPYTITLTLRDRLENEEVEPNDRITDAFEIREGEQYLGFLGGPDDIDVFRLPALPEATMVAVNITEGGQGDFAVEVLDVSDNQLLWIDSAGAGEPEHFRFFAARGSHGALHLAIQPTVFDESSYEIPYRLSIRFHQDNLAQQVEERAQRVCTSIAAAD